MDGRWTLRWDVNAFAYKVGGTQPWPSNTPVPVVPCDDAAVERGAEALVKIAARWGLGEWQMSGARELATEVLRAAGESSS